MKVVLAADHGGFELKERLKEVLSGKGYEILDEGCNSLDSVDYPDFADRAVQQIVTGKCDCGILVCGTGIGMSIAANRNNKIRAAVCFDEYTAKMSREHNNANILCLGARVLSAEDAEKISSLWLNTDFSGGRHQRRIEKFSD